MKIFVTGGTGFVGKEIVRQLLAAGHEVRCLVRPGSENKLPAAEGLEACPGDATDPVSLEGRLQDCDGVIHLIGIIREFPKRGITFEKLNFETAVNLVRAAERQGVGRFIHMSANGAAESARCNYFQTKYRAEKTVINSNLDWTVFRPSIIFGKDDAFTNLLADIIRYSPVIPVIGDGQYRLAPVALGDVANCFVGSLRNEKTNKRSFSLCGPDEVAYDRLLDIIAEALKRSPPRKIHLPVSLVKPFIALLEGFSRFPVTGEQLEMLLAGNICRNKEWPEVFQIQPQAFANTNLGYLKK